ncbi:tetratricopeptide repeat protein [Bacteroides sp. 214]|uniref:tetratricopeptide repeat protein n=1 Tax=Bacteroides sp. 214 TaxID=2302935 RepID=UPI0013D2B24B|nr:tetratricopeptide repeat protein [Bacteroides sp. 214]NDW13365.1 tetratricopeptide repeat protein [Bacteroides sp. 214]
MIQNNLQQWIQHPKDLNKDTLYELRNLLLRFPYCQSLRLLYLKNLYLLHDASFGGELRKSVLYITDRRLLFYLIEGDKYQLSPKQKQTVSVIDDWAEEPNLDRTLSLIDAFLSTTPEEDSLPVKLDYVTDYTAYLLKEEPQDAPEKPRVTALIDDFMENTENETIKLLPQTEEEEGAGSGPNLDYQDVNEDDSYFTETLAKIYIKQQRYSKALEIIKKLSLKYPKKNAYFADQIRFLEKLIINANSK